MLDSELGGKKKKKKGISTEWERLHKKKSLGTKPKLNSKGETVATERNQEPENVFAKLQSKCEQTDKVMSYDHNRLQQREAARS